MTTEVSRLPPPPPLVIDVVRVDMMAGAVQHAMMSGLGVAGFILAEMAKRYGPREYTPRFDRTVPRIDIGIHVYDVPVEYNA